MEQSGSLKDLGAWGSLGKELNGVFSQSMSLISIFLKNSVGKEEPELSCHSFVDIITTDSTEGFIGVIIKSRSNFIIKFIRQ